ncbi:MAG TPA: alpha/beta hydrolase [Usitatibacter sp.]|nr:alpha/beta hydrolase [Usitatibacter sp.]
MDRDFIEREYTNRALVPEHPQYFARWERDSQYVRATLPGRLDLAYGRHERQKLDIFPAKDARGTLVFIHGGYWRSLDKDLFAWLAAPFVAAGIGVALPRYRLVPEVTIEDTVEDAIDAVAWLFANGARHGLPMQRVVLSGWSAGGHLAAAVFAAPRERLAFDPSRIAGGVALSGIYDFEPLRHYSFNAEFGLDPAAVARLDLAPRRPTIPAPLLVAAGADESSEFRRQTELLAKAWRPQSRAPMLLPGVNHYSIVDAFAERGQPLHEAALAFF